MQKGDKVRLVKACPELDSVMKVSVGDIGICTCNPEGGLINVKFGKINYPFILCSRLEVVDDGLPAEVEKFNRLIDIWRLMGFTNEDVESRSRKAEVEKFNRLIDIAIKEYDGLYTDEIDFFVEFLRKKIMEVSK